jgi:hypothetical protein
MGSHQLCPCDPPTVASSATENVTGGVPLTCRQEMTATIQSPARLVTGTGSDKVPGSGIPVAVSGNENDADPAVVTVTASFAASPLSTSRATGASVTQGKRTGGAMRGRGLAAAAAATVLLAGCGGGSPQPPGDHKACRYYRQWLRDRTGFGTATGLLDAAMRAASAVPGSDAKAIGAGAATWPKGSMPAHLLWDLSNVQLDAEGDVRPPAGWDGEVTAVTLDCDNGL